MAGATVSNVFLWRWDTYPPEGLELDHATGVVRKLGQFPSERVPGARGYAEYLWFGLPQPRRTLLALYTTGRRELFLRVRDRLFEMGNGRYTLERVRILPPFVYGLRILEGEEVVWAERCWWPRHLGEEWPTSSLRGDFLSYLATAATPLISARRTAYLWDDYRSKGRSPYDEGRRPDDEWRALDEPWQRLRSGRP